MLERKLCLTIKSVSDESEKSGLYSGVAASGDVDRLMERVDLKGLVNLTEYLQNPILLFNHDVNNPVGVVEAVDITENEIHVQFRFANTPKAQEVKQLVDDGVLRALSIGFLSLKQEMEGNTLVHKQWRWLETSIVTLPANPKALITRDLEDEMEKRGTTPFADLPIYDDESREWDADASEKRWRNYCGVETNDDLNDPEKRRKYRQRFFWWDGDGTNFSGYKLPFVDVINGKPYAVWRGIVAAMAALLGARGGVDIPEADRKEVYNHIAKYYKKAGKEPPDYHKALELVDAISKFVSEVAKCKR